MQVLVVVRMDRGEPFHITVIDWANRDNSFDHTEIQNKNIMAAKMLCCFWAEKRLEDMVRTASTQSY